MITLGTAALTVVLAAYVEAAAQPAAVIDLWPGSPPGEPMEVGPETDMTKPDGRMVGGRRVMRLGNVANPQLHVFLPPEKERNGTLVVVCPGGGFSILAWDLEGTEVAEWLNARGVGAAVLKYRVPTRDRDPRWLAPAQDAQRAMSVVRSRARAWSLASDRIGIMGFSAGGATAARVTLQKNKRLYEPVDAADEFPYLPDFGVFVYSAGIVTEDKSAVQPELMPTTETPPCFLVHAADDGVPVENPVRLFLALRGAGVPAELHVYEKGGHGYGLRPVEDSPVTSWPQRLEAWMEGRGLLGGDR